jgi:CRISPR-associated endoribonuclease Cas6
MQLVITQNLEKELRLPLGYHHIVQSAIYRCMGNEDEYGTFLHDKGYSAENRNFKMFTFGMLRGKYSIEGKQIVFRDIVTLEVRSAENMVIERVAAYVEKNGITYLGENYRDLSVKVSDYTVESSEVTLHMQSPICVYSTNPELKKTYFYSPDDAEFVEMVNASFKRKYQAYYGIEPDSDICITPLRVTSKDRTLTKYKGFYITAWNGIYFLEGKRKYLDFLYQTGLGSKTSQGFGMFDVLG